MNKVQRIMLTIEHHDSLFPDEGALLHTVERCLRQRDTLQADGRGIVSITVEEVE